MATRRSDLGIPRSSPVSPATLADSPGPPESNRITTHTLQPRDPLVDPSPFSRPAQSASREERIARAAYHRAEQRGFAPGGELGDWLSAEREIDGDGA